ncbi:PQQ-binding-like beta-propeller repeat protein, partial [Streptomyces sp. T-3]|nr:PQQ-binding-like beta-propeller repeat protein [Streptomyces sp. T-3]
PLPAYAPQTVPQRAGGTGRRGKMIAGVAGALVLLIVAAVAVVVRPWSDSSDSPAAAPANSPSPSHSAGPNGKAGFTWALTRSETGYFIGLWSAGDDVVLGTDEGLTAYDAASGAPQWSWQPPNGGLLCNMTHTTEADVGAITYGVFNSEVGGIEQCDQLQTIDVASGKTRWSQPVSLQGKGAKGFPNRVGGSALSISDGVVSAAYAGPATKAEHGHTDVLAADVRTGSLKWSTDFGGRPMAKGCRLSGHAKALGKTVYAIGTCGKSKAAKLLALRDGKKAGRPTVSVAGALPSCSDIRVGVLSAFMTANADHVLVSCGHPTTKLFTVSAGSDRPVPVDLDGVAASGLRDGYSGVGPPGNVVLAGDRVYLVQGEDVVGGGESNGVVAVDLTSGKQDWQASIEGASMVMLLAAGDDGVEVLAGGSSGLPSLYTVQGAGQVTRGDTMKPEQGRALEGATGLSGPQVVRAGGHVVAGFSHAVKDDDILIAVAPSGAKEDQ